MSTATQPPAQRVWDPLVRLCHWVLVACVAGCWITQDSSRTHEWLGYAALAVVLLRTLWGFSGPRFARFAAFVPAPARAFAYGRALLRGQEARHLGHNPLGGWMIVALLLCAAVAAGSGALFATDAFWGDELLHDIHTVSSWGFVLLVPLHVAGVLLASWRHRENLAWAMVTGRKRGAAEGDVS